MTRVMLALTLVLLVAGRGSAQPVPSFEELGRRLKIDDRVRIRDSTGATLTGRVTRLTVEELSVDTGSGESRFTVATVKEIGISHRSTRLGALAGAVTGAVVVGIPECNGDPHDQCGEGIVMGAFLGAGIGAIGGAFVQRTTVIYRAADHEVEFLPALGARAIGLVARVRW